MGKDKKEEQVPAEEEEEKPEENGTDEEKPAENGDVKDEKEKGKGGKDKKSKGKDEKEKEKENGTEKEGSDEELGSLEKPVTILTNKRERKSTEFFVDMKPAEQEKEEDLDFTKGEGKMLKDIPFVLWQINHADAEDLMVLHSLMFRKKAKPHLVKKNIRQFCGFPCDQEHKMYKSCCNFADRLIVPGLRYINGLLGLEKSTDKEKMRNELMDFLMKPKDTGKKLPAPKKSAPKKKSKSKSKSPRKRAKTPRKAKDPKKDDEDDEDDDVSEASDSEDSDQEEEEEEEQEQKKEKKSAKSPKSKKTPVKIAVPLPQKKKSKSKKRKADSEESSEEDEPLVKKKKGPPTDAELKKNVSEILKDADLEQVTMKNVVKQVYDKYSSFDLTSRKDFIKNCVKDFIS